MNFNENDFWRNKTELLNLKLSKLPITKVLLKLEFDTEYQVLSFIKSYRTDTNQNLVKPDNDFGTAQHILSNTFYGTC